MLTDRAIDDTLREIFAKYSPVEPFKAPESKLEFTEAELEFHRKGIDQYRRRLGI